MKYEPLRIMGQRRYGSERGPAAPVLRSEAVLSTRLERTANPGGLRSVRRSVACTVERDDVHAHRALGQLPVMHDEVARRTGNAPLLGARDAGSGAAETAARPVANFDKYDRRVLSGDQIDFTKAAGVLSGEYLQTC